MILCLQVLYSGYLGLGPWGVANFLKGEPLGIFMLGRIMYYQQGQRQWRYSVDTSITTVVVMASYLIPMTLLCASLARRSGAFPLQTLELEPCFLHASSEHPVDMLLTRSALSQCCKKTYAHK